MTIPWKKCSERMPPADEIIVQYQEDKPKIFDGSRITDSLMRLHPNIMRDVKWIPFDEPTWNLLNNIVVYDGKTQVRLDHNGVPTVYQVQVDTNELKSKSGDKS